MMTGQKSDWQEIRLDFFKEEVLSRFWNHEGETTNLILEIQYMPALMCGEPNRRAFIGAGITLDFPFNTRPDNVKTNLLKDNNLEALREYEREHAIGFAMTGDDTYKVDSVTLAYSIKEPHSIFMQNFGEDYSDKVHPIFLWYNVGRSGKIDEKNVEPNRSSMIRVRYLRLDYFMSVMKNYVESGYKEFPDEFLEDDYRV
jgi:hypothetical protein